LKPHKKTAKMKLPPHEFSFVKATAPFICVRCPCWQGRQDLLVRK